VQAGLFGQELEGLGPNTGVEVRLTHSPGP
jgi:hypothetical protein